MSSINSKMTALADAIRSKSGVSGKLSISGMTAAVNDIVINSGSDIDLSGVNVTADKMLSGIVAVGATGQKVTGNIQTVTPTVNGNTFSVAKGYVETEFTETIAESGASSIIGNKVTVPAGYLSSDRIETIPEAAVTETDSSVTISPGYVGEQLSYELGGEDVDLSFVTVTANDILEGVVAVDSDGNRVDGAIKTVAAYKEGDYVIVPVGNIAEEQTFFIPSSGGGSSEVEYGYITADGKVQKLDLLGDEPVESGEPVEMDIVAFVTGQDEPAYNPETPGGSGGTFELAKVTEYVPAVEEFTAPASITIEGIGSFGDPEYPEDSIDYSDANGTYYPTAKTADKTGYARKYKHETNDYWIIGYLDVEGWYESDIWFIADYEDAESPLDGFLFCADEPNLTTGTAYWHNEDWGEGFELTTTVNIVTTPAAPMTLKGVRAKRYDGELRAWIVGTAEFSLGAYNIPKIGRLYALADNCTVGNEIASDAADAIPRGFTSNTSIDGYVINQSSGGGSYPDAWCIFNQNYTGGEYAWWTGSVGISESNPGWFSIEVPEAFVPSGIWIMNEIQSPENFKNAVFQGSNDGSTWEDIYTINNSPNTEGYRQEHLFNCNKSYNHFRMLFTASYAGGVSIQAFKIYKLSVIEEE